MTAVSMNQDKDFQVPEEGNQPARIYGMIDVGTQPEEYQGQTFHKPQIWLRVELPESKMDDGRPMTINKKVNLFIGDRALLTKIAKDCGLPEPIYGFQPASLVGKACNVTIKHYTTKAGKKGSDIKDFSMLLKGQQVPPMHNKPIILELDKFDKGVFDSLPDFFKTKIMASPQYQGLGNNSPGADLGVQLFQEGAKIKATAQVEPSGYPDDDSDSIPF